MGVRSDLTCWHCGSPLESVGARCTACIPPVSSIELELPLYTINTHVRCVRCGYDLHGLAVEGMCAECQCPVRRSLELDSLANADQHYLRSLYWGVTLFCAGFTFGATTSILTVVVNYWRLMRIPQALSILIWIITLLATYCGFYLLSLPDPAQRASAWSPDARVLARCVLVLLLISNLIMILHQFNTAVASSLVPAGLLALFTAVLQAGFVSACAAYARTLFVRIGRFSRAEVARTLIWQLPLLHALGFCIPANVVCQVLLVGLLWPLRHDLAAMLQPRPQASGTPRRYAP